MTAKEFLDDVWYCKIQLDTLWEDEQRIRHDICALTSMDYSVPRVSGGKTVDMADKIDKLMEAKKELSEQWDRWIDLRIRACTYIDRVNNVRYQAILRQRYICHKQWSDVAETMGYAESSVKRLHAVALEAFAKVYNFQDDTL